MPEPKNAIIRTDGTLEEYLPASGDKYTLEELKEAIGGGYVQVVHTADGRLMFCDEEGKLKRLPLNSRATDLYPYGGFDPIVGDVLVCEEWRLD